MNPTQISPVNARKGRRRTNERGAVIFIVAMTLSVLAALGMYAIGATATDSKVAGYTRQRVQAQNISEFGVVGAAAAIDGPSAQVIVGMMSGTKKDTNCASLPKPGTPAAALVPDSCRRMGVDELSGRRTLALGESYAPGERVWENAPFGSITKQVSGVNITASAPFGPYPVQGSFYVEITDPVQVRPPSGMDTNLGLCYMQMTVSSIGVVQPFAGTQVAASGSTADPVFSNQANQTSRARLTAGPLRCSR